MANAPGHGGYRQPEHPAPVSGPGALSKRTDGQVKSVAPDQPYGAMKAQLDQQRTQPLAAAPPMPHAAPVSDAGAQTGAQLPQYQGGPFGGPSTRPNEPVTAGAPVGPGPGPEVLSNPSAPAGMGATNGSMTRLLTQFAPTDGSGVIAALLTRAQSLGV